MDASHSIFWIPASAGMTIIGGLKVFATPSSAAVVADPDLNQAVIPTQVGTHKLS